MGWRGDAWESPPALILETWVFPVQKYPSASPALLLPSLNNWLFPASLFAVGWREVARGFGLCQPRGDLSAVIAQGTDGDGAIPGAQPFWLWLAGFPPISLRKKKNAQPPKNSDEKDLILAQNREDRGSEVLKKGK